MSGGFEDLFSQVQRMQSDMAAAQDALAEATVEGTAGGGLVRATMSGSGALQAVRIDPAAVDPADVEMLEDLVVAAVHDAARQVESLRVERLGAATGGVDLGALAGGLDLGALGLGGPTDDR